MGDLLVIAAVIAVEPIPLVAFILVLGTDRGRGNGLAFLAAWLVSLVAIVVATLAVTGGEPSQHATAPALVSAVLNVVVGVLLCGIAWRVHTKPRPRPRPQPKWMAKIDDMRLGGAAVLGFLVQPWGLVAAGATVVLQADLHQAVTVVVLVLFCVLATSTYAAMEIYVIARPEAARARLNRLKDWVDDHREPGIVALAGVVGVYLVAKGVYLIVAQRA